MDWLGIPNAEHIFLHFCNYIISSYCGTNDKQHLATKPFQSDGKITIAAIKMLTAGE